MHETKVAVTVAFLCILRLCQPILANINDVFHSWLLRPLEINSVQPGDQPSERVDVKLQQTLEDFLKQQSIRSLKCFINSNTDDYQKMLVTGVITGACKLADLTGSAFGAELSKIEEHMNNLSGYLHIWPLIRRMLVAAFALQVEKHGPLTLEAHEGTVRNILMKLFNQHKQSAQLKGAVEFMHVSKSGGTSFCRLAKDNGCRSENFYRRNCLIREFDDGPRYFDVKVHKELAGGARTRCAKGLKSIASRPKELSCHDRRVKLQKKRYTMYANEYTAIGGRTDPALAHACPNMLTVLEVRHPYNRTLSHIKHAWEWYRMYCGTDRENVYFAKPGHNTTRWWAALMPAPTNNYLIRSLLGEMVFQLPPGEITRDHLAQAMDFLAEQYDVVLVLEDQLLFKEGIRYGLGWDVYERHVNSNSDRESMGGEPVPEDLEALWDLNQLDEELYHFGVLMARLDVTMYWVVAAGANNTTAPTASVSTAAVAGAGAGAAAPAVPSPWSGVIDSLTASLGDDPGRMEGGAGVRRRTTRRLEGLMEGLVEGLTMTMKEVHSHFGRLPLSGGSSKPVMRGHCGWVGEKEHWQRQRQRLKQL